MTPVEKMLGMLTKVKGRNGSWTACCPAHNDKGPSLAIRETEDGRVLLHCFAGCETLDRGAGFGHGHDRPVPTRQQAPRVPS
jgi:DNA primase